MHTHIYPSVTELNVGLAQWIVDLISRTLLVKKTFVICLSGGNTPKGLYELLGTVYRTKVDWQKVHFFWGDERYVPFDDERNNSRMAFETLLDKINVSDDHIHRIRTDVPVEESIKKYVRLLHLYFNNKEETFDLVLLGMGDDGHTLSLFPGYRNDSKIEQWVKEASMSGNVRITLTPALVNRASSIVFLVAGKDKAQTLQQVIYGDYDPVKFPSQLIKPSNGNLHWFLDEAAALNVQPGK